MLGRKGLGAGGKRLPGLYMFDTPFHLFAWLLSLYKLVSLGGESSVTFLSFLYNKTPKQRCMFSEEGGRSEVGGGGGGGGREV